MSDIQVHPHVGQAPTHDYIESVIDLQDDFRLRLGCFRVEFLHGAKPTGEIRRCAQIGEFGMDSDYPYAKVMRQLQYRPQ